jgi:hypothetical protein
LNAILNPAVLQKVRELLCFLTLAAVSLLGFGSAIAFAKDRPAYFLPEERRIIENYYRSGGPSKGLPPGLAKRGGKLPPGLQKHLDKNGTLPPGLQKRLQPLPTDLDGRLPAYRTTGRESFSKEMSFSLTGAAIESSISSKT